MMRRLRQAGRQAAGQAVRGKGWAAGGQRQRNVAPYWECHANRPGINHLDSLGNQEKEWNGMDKHILNTKEIMNGQGNGTVARTRNGISRKNYSETIRTSQSHVPVSASLVISYH